MNKGFTIIELIVVIAIIAVLAAIVLVNVIGYINKANDAAIKENLNTIFVNSASYFATNGNYANFFTDPGCSGPAAAIKNITGNSLTENTNFSSPKIHFCVCSQLTAISNDVYCIDDTGKKIETTAFSCSLECSPGGACL